MLTKLSLPEMEASVFLASSKIRYGQLSSGIFCADSISIYRDVDGVEQAVQAFHKHLPHDWPRTHMTYRIQEVCSLSAIEAPCVVSL